MAATRALPKHHYSRAALRVVRVGHFERVNIALWRGLEHLVRYYGWYSNKSRGQRAKRQPVAAPGTADPVRPPTAREARKGWAALLKQVYEADPLCCPKCGSEMKIIAFIERRQTEVIEKILRHCGLWEESPARSPPAPGMTVES